MIRTKEFQNFLQMKLYTNLLLRKKPIPVRLHSSLTRRIIAGNLPIATESFDMMFSFYAGFISQSCKKYLKQDGILVCNNSHGDASIAFTDPDYFLTAVVKRSGERFRISSDSLDAYFHKKDKSPIDTEKVLRRMTGENFTKKAYAYIFRYHRN